MEDHMRAGKRDSRANLVRHAVYLFFVVCLLAGVDGCTRAFYRKAADKEVNDILDEKDKIPQCKIGQFHVYPDDRARYADPNKNPDKPSMPPDDPSTYDLSPHPQGPYHAGVANVEGTAYLEMIKAWDAQNREERAAEAKQAAGGQGDAASRTGPVQSFFDEPLKAERPGFLLKTEHAVELGVINSRTYQSFREDLYLAALPVTLQRFSFVFQFAMIENAVRQWAGTLSTTGYQNNWNLGTTTSVSKMFSTGALLTASFANNTVFNFAGNAAQGLTSVSTINLNFIQPLLQGGGKAVALEPLTQVERNLVYSIRAYARFAKQFYLYINLGTSPPADLPAAAGTINGGGTPISVLAALGLASTDVAGGFVGILPTLYREVDMAADKKWVSDLEKALKLYEGYQEGGLFSPLQVAQVNSTLLQARNTVLADQQFVTNAVDQVKLQLGIPVNLPLILDDAPARPVTRQLDRYYEVLADADAAYKLADRQDKLAPEKVRPFLRQLFTTDPLVRGTEFQKKFPPLWDAWTTLGDKDLEARLKTLKQEHTKLLDAKTSFEVGGKTWPPEEMRRLRENEFEADVGELEQALRGYEARPWDKQKEPQASQSRTKRYRLVSYTAQVILVWARNDRFARVATLWAELPKAPLEDVELLTGDVDKAQQVGVQYALANRVDAMNARAQVMDAWRQLRVTANALMGVFNVQYNLNSVTPANGIRPFAFSPAGTEQTLTLNAQLPLVRLPQRNAYRTALINYQRARRNLMNLEDNIAADVRFDVRQLHLFAENYKIQQKVLESLYLQVESALEVIVAPADPDTLKSTGTAGAVAGAALTNQYLGALSQLNGAQTKMYDIWLSFLATRQQLYLDLELMPLDSRGVWINEYGQSANTAGGTPGCATLGEPVFDGERRPPPAADGRPRTDALYLPPAPPPAVE